MGVVTSADLGASADSDAALDVEIAITDADTVAALGCGIAIDDVDTVVTVDV
jgi:hypothetical protein